MRSYQDWTKSKMQRLEALMLDLGFRPTTDNPSAREIMQHACPEDKCWLNTLAREIRRFDRDRIKNRQRHVNSSQLCLTFPSQFILQSGSADLQLVFLMLLALVGPKEIKDPRTFMGAKPLCRGSRGGIRMRRMAIWIPLKLGPKGTCSDYTHWRGVLGSTRTLTNSPQGN